MHFQRKRKMKMILLTLAVLGLVTALVMYALRQNISLFYTPSQLMAGEGQGQSMIHVGGMVVKNSIIRQADSLVVQFKITDYKQTLTINYQGILPDLFREGQGIVAKGQMLGPRFFEASEVLAKHDANYMPPAVKEALRRSAQTRLEVKL